MAREAPRAASCVKGPRRSFAGAVIACALALAACGGGRGAVTAQRHRAEVVTPAGARPAPLAARLVARQDAAVRRVLGYTPYIEVGSRRRRDVALTFDDGPSAYTPKLLALLRREHVPATFFVIGRQAQMYPALVAREHRGGFVVGDHTQTHPLLAVLSPAAQVAQLAQAAQHIRAAGGGAPVLFRPPYGSFDAATIAAARRLGMLMVLWTVDTRDFSRPGTQRIVYTALSGARGGAIILMHDGGGPRDQTLAAVPRIVRKLRRRGFHLVTVPQLVRDDPPPRGQGPARSLAGVG